MEPQPWTTSWSKRSPEPAAGVSNVSPSATSSPQPDTRSVYQQNSSPGQRCKHWREWSPEGSNNGANASSGPPPSFCPMTQRRWERKSLEPSNEVSEATYKSTVTQPNWRPGWGWGRGERRWDRKQSNLVEPGAAVGTGAAVGSAANSLERLSPCAQKLEAFIHCAKNNSGDLNLCYGFNRALKECIVKHGV
ncbi:uncharacterized protein [Watersipora subatra]|uniref:uncharacterized protein n=1 Tax=Watersipora subatra TaxID=2589382 RepID=UPI00355B4297